MASLVIAEHDNHSLKPATLNTVTAALACAPEVHVLVAGHNAGAAAAAAAHIAGVTKVLHADDAGMAHGLAENIAAQVLALAAGYTHILFPATAGGRRKQYVAVAGSQGQHLRGHVLGQTVGKYIGFCVQYLADAADLRCRLRC